MAQWEHSHNLKETTRQRLISVVRELEVERGRRLERAAPAEVQQLDQTLALLQQALSTLPG